VRDDGVVREVQRVGRSRAAAEKALSERCATDPAAGRGQKVS
jgi:hypothetical protein